MGKASRVQRALMRVMPLALRAKQIASLRKMLITMGRRLRASRLKARRIAVQRVRTSQVALSALSSRGTATSRTLKQRTRSRERGVQHASWLFITSLAVLKRLAMLKHPAVIKHWAAIKHPAMLKHPAVMKMRTALIWHWMVVKYKAMLKQPTRLKMSPHCLLLLRLLITWLRRIRAYTIVKTTMRRHGSQLRKRSAARTKEKVAELRTKCRAQALC